MTYIYPIIAWIGAGLALFGGRRLYPFWLGFAAFLFTSRVFDILLYHLVDPLRFLGSFAAGLFVTLFVLTFRRRVLRWVLVIGGFLVMAAIAEQLLGFVYPQASKLLMGSVLVLGGLLGAFLFNRWLEFDDAVMLLSALWGAGVISVQLRNLLGFSLLIQTLSWLGLLVAGILVQRRQENRPSVALPDATIDWTRKNFSTTRPMIILIIVFLGMFLSAGMIRLTPVLRDPVQNAFSRIELSLGLQSTLPGEAPLEVPNEHPPMNLSENDRILFIAPHPDDDILFGGGLLQQALEMQLPVRVVYLTSGDYNEPSYAYYRKEVTLDPYEALSLANTRHQEAIDAEMTLGVNREQLTFLGYPDGGGLDIFENHWGNRPAYRSRLSQRSAVPFKYAKTPAAPYTGQSILKDLEDILVEFKPTKVITSHPGDAHPDHQALPLFLQVALWDLRDQINPEVFYFITHFGRWPLPRGYLPDQPLEPPSRFDEDHIWKSFQLSPAQRQVKLDALKHHKTQWDSDQPYLESLVRKNELFASRQEFQLSQKNSLSVLPDGTTLPSGAAEFADPGVQAAYVDVRARNLRRENGDLIFNLEFARPLSGDVRARIWAMGYRHDVPFGEMPKLLIELGAGGVKLYDRGRSIHADSIIQNLSDKKSEVRIPLSLLGDPERLLMDAQTTQDDLPLDSLPWIFLDTSQN